MKSTSSDLLPNGEESLMDEEKNKKKRRKSFGTDTSDMFGNDKYGAGNQDERVLREEDQMVNVGSEEAEEKKNKKKKEKKKEKVKEENSDEVASQSGISTEGLGHLQGSDEGFPERRNHDEGKRREKKRKKLVEEKLLEEKADAKKKKVKVADEDIAGDHGVSLHSHDQSGNDEDSNGNCHQKEDNAKNQDREKQAATEGEEEDPWKGNKEKPKKQRRNKFHDQGVDEHEMCSQGTCALKNDQKSCGQTGVSENADAEIVSDGTGATSRKTKNKKGKRSKEAWADEHHFGEKKKEKAKNKKNSRELKGIKDSSKSGKRSKHVSFADSVEVFTFVGDHPPDEKSDELQGGLIQGKRFTKKEDEMVMEAIDMYIKAHGLGESGWEKVMNCKKHPEVRHCWKEIGATMPWRPYRSIYIRAHVLYESRRSELRKWTDEERETVLRYVKFHGKKWRQISDMLGKHRFHVKDLWRRTKSANYRKGRWSQEEYQQLFDMVNFDLQTRASEEKDTKHGMLRDNIAWEAISDKLATRSQVYCCIKWYNQLASPLVKTGLWANIDDHLLLGRLLEMDACNVDDVDWDNLLDNRSGELCRKRWEQMTRHIGDNRTKSFEEQVHLLVSRYCPNLLE
ncbi:RNA polymerase I termination factor [Nymphaea colorata]|nr:RNA polymerase I termination factor [Nymphaea colorata]XP_031485278.1 RNA polymerase I termination factor [Nymphaea colorata]XP_031485279.1 RNA polymerase I termination factor [Nymphaea colorata]XP_031485280.1 RNA polymerase I termination factor [Nymphaea colorata]XP_049933893.1 RNA polymerase I termination factor [Nymphaea colorata]